MPGYRPDIDGLRAIAVTAVVLFHAGLWPLRSGYIGVDVFFVISGYLIGGIIYRDAARQAFSFARFYARRARRILPALIVVVVSSLLLGLLLLSPGELKRLAMSAGSALAGGSNFRFWMDTGYFAPSARLDPMLMTWSLGVEEQFYLVLPFVLLALRPFSARIQLFAIAGLTLASLAVSIVMTARFPNAAFYLLPSRGWELGAGVLLAVWQAQGRHGLSATAAEAVSGFGLAAITASLLVFDEKTPFPGVAALLPVVGTVALIACAGSRINSRLLGHRIPVGIGRVSYSWYLWHWPLMTFANLCSFEPLPVWVLLVIALVSLLLAVLTWHLVEQPFRSTRLPDGRVVFRYVLVVSALLVVVGGLIRAEGLPQRGSPQIAEVEGEVLAARKDPCLARNGVDTPNVSAACVAIEPGRPAVAILGDSHAAALGLGLRGMARQQGWGFQIFTKSSCRPLLGVTVWKRDVPTFSEECARFMQAAFKRVAEDPSVHTVILSGLWAGPLVDIRAERYQDLAGADDSGAGARLLASGLTRAVHGLGAAGKRVLIAEDVPYWRVDPVKVFITEKIPLRMAVQGGFQSALGSDALRLSEPRNLLVDRLVADTASHAGAGFLPLRAAFCEGDICRFKGDEHLWYSDRSHLFAQGAIHALSPWVDVIFAQNPASSVLH